jgi:pyroglutamyl-peptidase
VSTVLVTGFEAFGGDGVNPSWLIAQALHGQDVAGARVQAVQLPCRFGSSLQALNRALKQHRPELVLALGQAGRPAIGLERVAVNVIDARIADNDGMQAIDQPVIAGAPAAYFSTLPIKAMLGAVRRAGWPVEVSMTAGSFVCNQVFFGLMHTLHRLNARQRRLGHAATRGGFVHVPMLPEQAAQHGLQGLALPDMQAAIAVALATAMDERYAAADALEGAGRLD